MQRTGLKRWLTALLALLLGLAACGGSGATASPSPNPDTNPSPNPAPGANDIYMSFAELSAAETEGADWRIVHEPRGSALAVIAIHGGGIEPGSSELARALAGTERSLYLFEGLKSSGNSVLHITSTRFDEPQSRALVQAADYCISVHGCTGTEPVTHVGGRDEALREAIAAALRAAGFDARLPGELGFAEHFSGTGPQNICNITTRGMGVQLEISRAQRAAFFGDIGSASGRKQTTPVFENYVAAIISAMPGE